MRPVINETLRQRRWSIFWWSLGVALFIVTELGVYSSIKSQAAQLNETLKHLPSSVKSLFGGNSDLFSPVGYLNSRLFYLLLPLLLTILAIGWGSSLLAKEEDDGTLELLLARPISRGRLILAKILSGSIITIIVSVVGAVVTLGLVEAVGIAVPLPQVAYASLMALVLSLAFGALAFCIAAMGRTGRATAIGITSLVGLGSYVIASLQTNVHWLLWPSRLLPYHYYNPTEILNGHYTVWPLVAFLAGILILFILSWRFFRSRDLA